MTPPPVAELERESVPRSAVAEALGSPRTPTALGGSAVTWLVPPGVPSRPKTLAPLLGLPPDFDGDEESILPAECRPDYDKLVIEDGQPVDSLFQERNMRLLVDALYASWVLPAGRRNFAAYADVGLFFYDGPAVVPDVMVSMDILPQLGSVFEKWNNSYFVWRKGKSPDVAIEIVSKTPGGEDTEKLELYAIAAVPNYVIYDPRGLLSSEPLRVYELMPSRRYTRTVSHYFPGLELGLRTWEGEYQGLRETYLRWCLSDGTLLPTADERIATLAGTADAQTKRADELNRQLDEQSKRADEQSKRADEQSKRADEQSKRADELNRQLDEQRRRIEELEAQIRRADRPS